MKIMELQFSLMKMKKRYKHTGFYWQTLFNDIKAEQQFSRNIEKRFTGIYYKNLLFIFFRKKMYVRFEMSQMKMMMQKV